MWKKTMIFPSAILGFLLLAGLPGLAGAQSGATQIDLAITGATLRQDSAGAVKLVVTVENKGTNPVWGPNYPTSLSITAASEELSFGSAKNQTRNFYQDFTAGGSQEVEFGPVNFTANRSYFRVYANVNVTNLYQDTDVDNNGFEGYVGLNQQFSDFVAEDIRLISSETPDRYYSMVKVCNNGSLVRATSPVRIHIEGSGFYQVKDVRGDMYDGAAYSQGFCTEVAFGSMAINSNTPEISVIVDTQYGGNTNASILGIPEKNYTNNYLTKTLALPSVVALPDLVIRNIEIVDSTTPGMQMYRITYQNQGGAFVDTASQAREIFEVNISDTTINFYNYQWISALSVPAGYTGTVDIGPVNAGTTQTRSLTAHINSDHVIVQESDYQNNSFSKADVTLPSQSDTGVNTDANGPDFMISDLYLRGEDHLYAYVTVENKGKPVYGYETQPGMTTPTPKTLYIELASIGQDPNMNIDYFTEGMQEKYYPTGFKKQFRIGPFRFGNAETLNLQAKVDKYNGFIEQNENNNTFSKVAGVPAPDFHVIDLKVALGRNGQYFAYATLYNYGHAYSAVRYTSDNLEGQVMPMQLTLENLRTRQTYTATISEREYPRKSKISVRFGPIEATYGQYLYLKATADTTNAFRESNDRNNSRTGMVKVSRPDFYISSVSAKRDTATNRYYALIRIRNKGTGITADSATDGRPLFFTIRNASTGSTTSANLTAVDYPTNYQEDYRYELGATYKGHFIVQLDPGNAYQELNENNNYYYYRRGTAMTY